MSTPVPGQIAKKQVGRYRAVSRAAVLSVVCGVLSITTVLSWYLAIIPILGLLLGWFALTQIRETPKETTGRGLALTGIILSAIFWGTGHGYRIFRQVSEVPFGYVRVSYDDLQPDPDQPGERIPPYIFELLDENEKENQKVFLKGYMQAGSQHTRLKRFILCPSIANCAFCTPDPKPTEMVWVELQGDLKANYTLHEIAVGGKLLVDPDSPFGLPYILEADYLK